MHSEKCSDLQKPNGYKERSKEKCRNAHFGSADAAVLSSELYAKDILEMLTRRDIFRTYVFVDAICKDGAKDGRQKETNS